jgi:TetR/AcrR family transcriptional regulator, mexJK operon transcriptional repressor
MAAKGRTKRRKGPGRLSTEETAQLESRLLDAAEAVFIERGFERATFDAIAQAAGVTRKTIYARYADKEAIFAAVIERLRYRPPQLPTQDPAPIEQDPRARLLQLAHTLIIVAETPQAAGLGRLVFAEAYRSPELVRVVTDLHARTLEGIRYTLEPLRAEGKLPLMPDAAIAASIFLEMVLAVPRARAIFGVPWPRDEMTAHTEAAVDLFLRGCGYQISAR